MIIKFNKGKKIISMLTAKELEIVPRKGDFIQVRQVTEEGDEHIEGYLNKTVWYFSSGNDGMPNITFTIKDKKD